MIMKRLITLCIAITLLACKEDIPKDYVTLSGKIENADNSKVVKLLKGRDLKRTITLNDDGTFIDTLKVEEGDYTLQHGNKYGPIFLKNDNESSITADYSNFEKSMVFDGDASDINNFTIQSFLISNDYFTNNLIANGLQQDLDDAIKNYRSAYQQLKAKYKDVDSLRIANTDRKIEGTVQQITRYMSSKIAMRSAFPAGKASPVFEDYENFKGGNMSLGDLKGKYVYIDVWATWCGPCIREIPSLKRIEKQFENKNIAFVSISVDEGRGYKGNAAEAYKGWKKMVADKNLGGIQLLADNGFRSRFIEDYKINSIPRFLLIGPDGTIVNADAPRPSNPKLVELFNSLDI